MKPEPVPEVRAVLKVRMMTFFFLVFIVKVKS